MFAEKTDPSEVALGELNDASIAEVSGGLAPRGTGPMTPGLWVIGLARRLYRP
ncbi:MAG: hypothetical protein ACK5JR_06855 [Tropicimonas sp.]|uniref:hypothetical protein n=1 Tax=Tropicimonas sp. TaxID=2067044 RepID=UPI003A858CB1